MSPRPGDTEPRAPGSARERDATDPATPAARSPGRRSKWSRVWALVVVPLITGMLTMSGALVVIVVVGPLGWRLLAAAILWIPGVAALILFSDGLDQVWHGGRRRWAAELLHWLSASFVALAFAIVAGAVVSSLLGLSDSPPVLAALACDTLIGILAGVLTLALTALGGLGGGELSYIVKRMRWVKEKRPESFRLSLRDTCSIGEAIRMIVLPVAGVLLSAVSTQAFAAAPSNTAATAADTTPELPSVGTSIVLPLVVWFVVTGLVWLAFDRVGYKDRQIQPHSGAAELRAQPPHRRRRRATHASALAIGLAILIGWTSSGALDDVIHDSLATRGTVTAVSIQSVPPAKQVAYLAQQFVPQFKLAAGEHWEPTKVDWYVAHSRRITSPSFCVPGSRTGPQGCRQLCRIKTGATCAPLCDDPDPQTCAPSGGNPSAVYYLYLDATNTPHDHPARSGHQWAVLEYWIFYNYDSLNAGLVTQWHQSDWEQVSVLVERRGPAVYPVEVGFSEHCYGAAVPATEVSWSGSHPVALVGLGSHANYPTQNDLPIRQLQCLTRRTGRYLGVAGLFFNPQVAGWSLELPIAYLIGLRDQTGQGRTVAHVTPIPLQATPSISSFHGYWGIDNNLQIVAGGIPTGAGPLSPQYQDPSGHAFKGMFCSPKWLKIAPTPATAWVCSS